MVEFVENILIGVREWVNGKLSEKQDALIAGVNIEISGDTISAIVPTVDLIDDTTIESGKTWSSEKIEEELSATSVIIEDVSYVVSSHINELHELVDILEENKQDKLIAGENIEISGNTINALVPTIDLIDDATIESGKTWSSNKISSKLSEKQDVLVAGENIEISGDTISAIVPVVDVIDDETVESGKTWSSEKISSELSEKQNELTAGDNIDISGNTISAIIPPVDIIDDETIESGKTWSSEKISSGLTALEEVIGEKQDILEEGNNIIISGNTISVDIQVAVQEVLDFLNGNNNN